MKLEICGAKATQTAVPELGQAEKTLYYLIIGEEADKVVINVGQKTYDKIEALTKKHEQNGVPLSTSTETTAIKPAGMPKTPKPIQ